LLSQQDQISKNEKKKTTPKITPNYFL